MVVLSACETGLGCTAGGDGVLGLTRAFLTAGARSVVSSLWKVDDGATSLLVSVNLTPHRRSQGWLSAKKQTSPRNPDTKRCRTSVVGTSTNGCLRWSNLRLGIANRHHSQIVQIGSGTIPTDAPHTQIDDGQLSEICCTKNSSTLYQKTQTRYN